MGVIKSNKTVSKQVIRSDETFKVKLSLESEPDIVNQPEDIVLLLDESGSMNGNPLTELKKGVNNFLEIIGKATNGVPSRTIGGGSRVGIVSFSTNAKIERPLTTSIGDLEASVNSLVAGGSTNHADAFTKGVSALSPAPDNNKVLVMFTDGESNSGQEGFYVADRAKANGIEVYCLGFSGLRPIDESVLNRWASEPASDHVIISPDYNGIQQLFDQLAVKVTKPKATDIQLIDKVSQCFEVVSIDKVTKGNAIIASPTEVKWTVDNLGGLGKENICCEFTVKDVGDCVGVVNVNKLYLYKDKEGNTINLPKPTIEILADAVVISEDCPTKFDIVAEGCEDYISYDAGAITIDNIGRIVEVSTTIKNVCPNKRVALAVILTEVDINGVEQGRGMKTLLIPAHVGTECKDVRIRCIKFVLPEALDMSGDPLAMCNERNFKVSFVANYIDSDYDCCTL